MRHPSDLDVDMGSGFAPRGRKELELPSLLQSYFNAPTKIRLFFTGLKSNGEKEAKLKGTDIHVWQE